MDTNLSNREINLVGRVLIIILYISLFLTGHKDDLLRLETEKQQLKAKLQETKMRMFTRNLT